MEILTRIITISGKPGKVDVDSNEHSFYVYAEEMDNGNHIRFPIKVTFIPEEKDDFEFGRAITKFKDIRLFIRGDIHLIRTPWIEASEITFLFENLPKTFYARED